MHRTPDPAFLALALLSLLLTAVALSPAQEQEMPSQEELERMMAEHARAGQPGPEHDRLATLEGTWDVEVTMWPEPGAEPVQLPTTVMESKMILGGRFLQQRGTAGSGEEAVETLSLIGFDRRNDLYNLMAMDTSGTYWVTASGKAVDEDTIVLSGTDWDGIIGHEQQYDFVLRWEDEDTLVTQIIFKDAMHTRGGPPHKMVETRGRRRPE